MRNPRAAHVNRTEATKLQGTIKFFNAEAGYGFIRAEDGGKDIFFRGERIVQKHQGKPITNGQPVLYRLGPVKDKGQTATDVEPIDEVGNV